MKKKKESSDSILNPKFKISEEAFKELSSGSDPLIYSSFDEAHDWFRELKRNLFRSVLKVNWRSIEYQCSKQSLTSALRIIEKDGNIRLIKLLSEDDKALLEFSYNKRPFKRQETIFKRMAELKDSNYLFAAATTEE